MHHHANAPRAGERDLGGVDGSVRSSVGTAGCIPTATSGSALTVRSTPLAGCSPRWKSRACVTYVKEAGKGASSLSVALAKTLSNIRDIMIKAF